MNLPASGPLFGFIQGHDYLGGQVLDEIKASVGKPDAGQIDTFEKQFANLVGEGKAVSFSAGRMGFYSLLKNLKISEGDEVILTGATCAVMANAVIRAGAKPVYSDIDPYTFGSDPVSIAQKITPRTRMIVAQHSFGIPCRIDGLSSLAKDKGIFLLEDCALSLDSSYRGVSVGNFGDAALFSTDHTKPINTFIGGLIYSKDPALVQALTQSRATNESLSEEKQASIWRCLMEERVYCRPDRLSRYPLFSRLSRVRRILQRSPSPYLDEDGGAGKGASYPYPAALPPFLAAVGLEEIARWEKMKQSRKVVSKEIMSLLRGKSAFRYVSGVYEDIDFDITPLRFVWSEAEGPACRQRLSGLIQTSWTWFLEPVISTTFPMEVLGYEAKTCPVSESIGPGMVNIPCNFQEQFLPALLGRLDEILD